MMRTIKTIVLEGYLYMLEDVDCSYPIVVDHEITLDEVKEYAEKYVKEQDFPSKTSKEMKDRIVKLAQDGYIDWKIEDYIKFIDLTDVLEPLRKKKVKITIEVIEQ